MQLHKLVVLAMRNVTPGASWVSMQSKFLELDNPLQ